MKQGPRKVILNTELADRSAAYMAMWVALESFDPEADRWSDPVDFGNREQRIKAAQAAIARIEGPGQTEVTRDIQAFRTHLKRLTNGGRFGRQAAEFSRHLRDTGSRLADQGVVAANVAQR